jgi:hypothetical protein
MSTHESNDWRRGVIYTVRPEILAPLERGRQYRILVGERRMASKSEPFAGYAELYRRALSITAARVAALATPERPSRWTEYHGWRALEFGDRQLIFTFIATVLKIGDQAPAGESAPTAEELAAPGGAALEQLQHRGRQRFDEFYNDFDHRSAAESPDPGILFSYGEYVPSAAAVDFEPFVHKSEALARYHFGPEVQVVRRDCFCTTHPDLAVVHLFFHL